MGMEDLSNDITYNPCYFLMDSTFKGLCNQREKPERGMVLKDLIWTWDAWY